ncbi:hypothetical protein TSOC_012218, partial [Tetrabaena socialis]
VKSGYLAVTTSDELTDFVDRHDGSNLTLMVWYKVLEPKGGVAAGAGSAQRRAKSDGAPDRPIGNRTWVEEKLFSSPFADRHAKALAGVLGNYPVLEDFPRVAKSWATILATKNEEIQEDYCVMPGAIKKMYDNARSLAAKNDIKEKHAYKNLDGAAPT